VWDLSRSNINVHLFADITTFYGSFVKISAQILTDVIEVVLII